MQRKIIQVAVMPEGQNNATSIIALCEDGSLFEMVEGGSVWYELPPIPQKPVERSFIGRKEDLSESYNEGYQAGYRNAIPSDCPYLAESEKYKMWHIGFQAGIKA